MKNKLSIITMILIGILTVNFRCLKDSPAPHPYEQNFVIPVDIVSLKKSYSLTDTIWLETDITGKMLLDTKSNQLILADTGQIDFGASFNIFGTQVTNPSNGFCDIVTIRGINTNRELGYWGTSGYLDDYGCGQTTYKSRVGFRPLIKGTYWLILTSERPFESCPNKVVPYNATLTYRYKTTDLGLEIFNALPEKDKGGNDGIKFYSGKIMNKEMFVFKVE